MKVNDEKIESRISELLFRRNFELVEVSDWIVEASNRMRISNLNTEDCTRNIDENVELLEAELTMNSNLVKKL